VGLCALECGPRLRRYDHRTRVVAYVLNAVNDSDAEVVATAMDALAVAGAEYERENQVAWGPSKKKGLSVIKQRACEALL
jgi:hypothetical protein